MNDKFLAIIFNGGMGSSWGYGKTKRTAVNRAAKTFRRDWLVTMPKQKVVVNVYDYSNAEGWYADHRGVFNHGTEDPLPLIGKENMVI